MNPSSDLRRTKQIATQSYQTGPLKLTLEGSRESGAGEWLLRKFAEANEDRASFQRLVNKRPWWRIWA